MQLPTLISMLSIDTNILVHTISEKSSHYERAQTYLGTLENNREVIIAELALVELYVILRNPLLFSPPLSPQEAVDVCSTFRNHPHWQLVENAEIMSSVWEEASHHHVARSRIFDLRLAKTLQAHGVEDFATANVKYFQNLGFRKVWNPLL